MASDFTDTSESPLLVSSPRPLVFPFPLSRPYLNAHLPRSPQPVPLPPFAIDSVAEACVSTLQAMNPLIRVAVQPGSAAAGLPDDQLAQYDTVVASGLSFNQIEQLEAQCRSECWPLGMHNEPSPVSGREWVLPCRYQGWVLPLRWSGRRVCLLVVPCLGPVALFRSTASCRGPVLQSVRNHCVRAIASTPWCPSFASHRLYAVVSLLCEP